MDITLNTLHTMHIDTNVLPDDRLNDVDKYLHEKYGLCLYDMPDSWEWTNDRGSWIKRLRSWSYKQRGIKIDPDLLAMYGNMLGKSVIGGTFHIELTDHANWEAGAFGEATDSCWFTDSYGRSRMGLFENGGLSLRAFSSYQQYYLGKQQKGIGRCWVIPTDRRNPFSNGEAILFNAYGVELDTFARLLSQWWQVPNVKRVSLDIDNAYINNGRGYLISAEKRNKDCFNLSSIQSQYVGVCAECNDKIDAETTYKRWDMDESVKLFHIKCLKKTMNKCHSCCGWYRKDDTKILDGKHFCNDCYRSNSFKCSMCKEVHYTYNRIWIHHLTKTRTGICERCAKARALRCECGNHYLGKEIQRHQQTCEWHNERTTPSSLYDRFVIRWDWADGTNET